MNNNQNDNNSNKSSCPCDYLLTLSGADNHSALRQRLINTIESLIPGSLTIIYDSTSENLILSNKKDIPSDNSHTLTHQIRSPSKKLLTEVNIYTDIALSTEQQTTLDTVFTLHEQINHLLNLSHYDALTQVLNRQSFDSHLSTLYKESLSSKRRHAETPQQHVLAMLDIDHFKKVNDSYGHLLGDEVLILISRLLKESLRDRDLIFRFGGEEFVLMITDCSPDQAELTLSRLVQNIASHEFPQQGNITVSIGYCIIDTDVNYDLLLERADKALYYVKSHGRNASKSYEELKDQGLINEVTQRSGDIELF